MKNYNKKINEIQKDYDNGFISLEDVIKRCDKIIEECSKQLNLDLGKEEMKKQNPLKALDQKRKYWEMKYKKLKTDLETAKRCLRFTNKDTCQNEACTNKICPVRNRWVK